MRRLRARTDLTFVGEQQQQPSDGRTAIKMQQYRNVFRINNQRLDERSAPLGDVTALPSGATCRSCRY
jgi:hypothetical protein